MAKPAPTSRATSREYSTSEAPSSPAANLLAAASLVMEAPSLSRAPMARDPDASIADEVRSTVTRSPPDPSDHRSPDAPRGSPTAELRARRLPSSTIGLPGPRPGDEGGQVAGAITTRS